VFYVQSKVITKQFLLLWTDNDSTRRPYIHVGQHCAGGFGTAV